MKRNTKLIVLYGKILEQGDEVLRLNRIMENFYFKYDISKKYVLEDLNDMLEKIRMWKKAFSLYNKISGEYLNELESKIQSDELEG